MVVLRDPAGPAYERNRETESESQIPRDLRTRETGKPSPRACVPRQDPNEGRTPSVLSVRGQESCEDFGNSSLLLFDLSFTDD